jgi:quercetin dioxygenase-like cupin family protein
MRMDGRPYPDESHDHPEGLLVIDGRLNLTIGNEAITFHAGELFVVPVWVAHAVAPDHFRRMRPNNSFKPTPLRGAA